MVHLTFCTNPPPGYACSNLSHITAITPATTANRPPCTFNGTAALPFGAVVLCALGLALDVMLGKEDELPDVVAALDAVELPLDALALLALAPDALALDAEAELADDAVADALLVEALPVVEPVAELPEAVAEPEAP